MDSLTLNISRDPVLGDNTGCDQKYLFYLHLLRPGGAVTLISVEDILC